MDFFDQLGLYSLNTITVVRAAATRHRLMKQILNLDKEAEQEDAVSSSPVQAAQVGRKEQIEREMQQEQFDCVLRELRQETICSFAYTSDTEYVDESAGMIFHLELNRPAKAKVKAADTSFFINSHHLKAHKPSIIANDFWHNQVDGFNQLEPSFDEYLIKQPSKTKVLVTNEKRRAECGASFLLAQAERVESLKSKEVAVARLSNSLDEADMTGFEIDNSGIDELLFELDMP
jgi:hypothetical protein